MLFFSRSRSLTHTGFGIRCQEAHARAGSFLYSIYQAACLIKNTEGKRHHSEEFKDRIGWESRWVCISSTIQCLQRKLCHNSGHYTKDHNRAVKHKLRERLGVQKPVWRTKADFFGSFCLQRLAGTQSGPMGISTFLPNKEQGFHVRNWATAMDQLTSLKPFYAIFFTACLGNSPAILLYSSGILQTEHDVWATLGGSEVALSHQNVSDLWLFIVKDATLLFPLWPLC